MSEETDRLEADISQSRHRLNDTLDALGSKLSPGQMLDETLGLAKGQAGQFAANLGRQLRDNPMPAALVAAGIALYVLGQRQQNHGAHAHVSASDWNDDRRFRGIEEARWRMSRIDGETDDVYHDRLHDDYARALGETPRHGEALEGFKTRVRKTVDGLEERVTQARDRIGQTFSGATSAMRESAQSLGEKAGAAKHSAQDLYADNPLVGGAIALAIGALLGSAAPLSDVERDALGDVADKAGRVSADLVEKSAEAVERAADNIH